MSELPKEDTNGGTFRVTLRDVAGKLDDLARDVAKATGAIEGHAIQPHHGGTLSELNDHENRLRKLEKVAWMALGIGSIAGIVTTVILYTLGQ